MDEPETSESPAFLSLLSTISNSVEFHQNETNRRIDDGRDFARVWRRRLRDAIQNERRIFTRFLVRDLSGHDTVQHHDRLLNEFGNALFNSNSEWIRDNTNSLVNHEEVLEQLQTDISMPIRDLQCGLQNAMNHYIATIHELFHAEESLESKLKTLDNLYEWIENTPSELEPSEELTTLQTAILNYVHSTYKRYNIRDDYTRFCTLFARFTALRSIVTSLQATDSTGSPLCSICTSEKVTYVILPCGHTFCNSCCNKQRMQCYICRTSIRERHRIYFS
jgi:hypothetical protein